MAVSGTAFQASRTHWQMVLYVAPLPWSSHRHPVLPDYSKFCLETLVDRDVKGLQQLGKNARDNCRDTANSTDPLFGDVADVRLHRVKDKEALQLLKDLWNIQIATSPSRHCPHPPFLVLVNNYTGLELHCNRSLLLEDDHEGYSFTTGCATQYNGKAGFPVTHCLNGDAAGSVGIRYYVVYGDVKF